MTGLDRLVADELAQPVDPRVTAMAAAIAAQHPGSLAVLFYGSCLRDATLGGMLDFYLIVADYRQAYDRRWLATANRLLPPNVFPFAHDTLSAKYAVLSLDHLRRECGAGARDPSTYARLSQPSRLVWNRDEAARADVAAAIGRAAPTLLALTGSLVPREQRGAPLARWRVAFRHTYMAELRAERVGRPDAIVDVDPARYARFAEAIPMAAEPTDAQREAAAGAWRRAARRGKRRQVAKLAKASLTFAGGVDYLAWKIARHSGQPVAVSPWQRRHPLLAALVMLPRLIARGQVR